MRFSIYNSLLKRYSLVLHEGMRIVIGSPSVKIYAQMKNGFYPIFNYLFLFKIQQAYAIKRTVTLKLI